MSFLNKQSIGVDISDDTIEVVQLAKNGTSAKIVSHGRIFLDKGIVENGRIKDFKALSIAFKSTLKKAKPTSIEAGEVYFTIADYQVYEHIFSTTENIKNKNVIEDLVSQEVEKSVPVKSNNLVVDYRIIGSQNKKTDIIITAIKKEVIDEWYKFFKQLKIDIAGVDIESSAVFRGLFSKSVDAPVAVVDIGANTTRVSMFHKKGLGYTHSINVAGNQFTKDLVDSFSVSYDEAEKLKIDEGLSGKKNKEILDKSLSVIVRELQAVLSYFHKKYTTPISKIILIGGTSKMNGLLDYLSESLKIDIVFGKSILDSKKDSKKTFEFIEAIGVALRPLVGKKLAYNFSFDEIKKYRKKARKNNKSSKSEKLPKNEKEKSDNKSNSNDKKLLFQKIALLVIIVLGIGLVYLSFAYRNYDRQNRADQINNQNNL